MSEDLRPSGDITTKLIKNNKKIKAKIISNQNCVIAGLKFAKEAFRSGDRIQSEYYYQFMDHYYRLMIEMGINVEENDVSFDAKTRESREIKVKKSEVSENFDLESSNVEKDNNSEDVENEENIESIESIPFIAEPVKKKRTLSKK